MVNFAESEKKLEDGSIVKNDQAKESKSRILKKRLKGMNDVVRTLENSLTESHLEEQRLLMQLHIDDVKNQRTLAQLEDAKKENKQIINILQQKCYEGDVPRSQIDVTSAYSTMSIVNLQYKYEELLNNFEGLLKVMALKDKDIQKHRKENESIRVEMNMVTQKLLECECTVRKICAKYLSLKEKKNTKINKLKSEKETLHLAHNQVVRLLHKQCTKNEELLTQQLQKTSKPERALLLQEVQRSNKLQHENMLLRQEIACLKSRSSFPNLTLLQEENHERIKNDAETFMKAK